MPTCIYTHAHMYTVVHILSNESISSVIKANMNWDSDCKKALTFIEEHELRDKIISMYIKGPPEDKGFSWWQNDTPEYIAMHGFILAMDYDSSAYAVMHRKIQESIRDMYHLTREKTVTTVAAPVILRIQAIFHHQMETGNMPTDPEEIMKLLRGIPVSLKQLYNLAANNQLRWIRGMGHPQTLEEYQMSMNEAMAQYLKKAAEGMDSPNRKAAEVWQKKGPAAACKHMFEQAGGDYGKMRSMFG